MFGEFCIVLENDFHSTLIQALGRIAYTDSSRFNRIIWLLIFILASGYTTYDIIGILQAFISGRTTTMTHVNQTKS